MTAMDYHFVALHGGAILATLSALLGSRRPHRSPADHIDLRPDDIPERRVR
jgi:hypothetical protein